MIKLAVFDWNGTILDDITLTLQATHHEFEVVGLAPFPLSKLRNTFEVPLKHYYEKMGVSKAVLAEKGEAMHIAFHKYYEKGVGQTKTRPGAIEVLDALHEQGITRIILSNHHVQGIAEQANRLKLSHHFDIILANDDIHGAMHMGKAARLEQYLLDNHASPTEAFIIGDTTEEVAIGKALGLKTVAITGGMYSVQRLKAAKPDVLISSLHDLIKVVEEWNRE